MITSTPVTSTTTTPSSDHYDAYHLDHQQLLDSNNDLSQSWFGDDSTTRTTAVAAVTVAASATEEDDDDDADDDDDEIDPHDTNHHLTEPGNDEPADSLTPIAPVTKDHHTALLSHTPIEALWTEDELVSLLAVTQDRKRKYEEEPTVVCQKGGPTPSPANRPDSSLPMVKV